MRGRLIWGVALIAIGAFFLAQQLGWFGRLELPFWAFAFGLLGVIFLVTFITDRRQWWALIPGFIMLGVAFMTWNAEAEFMPDTQAGALFLFSIGLPFLLIYLVDRRLWWALIPGGVLTVIALLTFVCACRYVPMTMMAAIILFSVAVVFAAGCFARRYDPGMDWATWV